MSANVDRVEHAITESLNGMQLHEPCVVQTELNELKRADPAHWNENVQLFAKMTANYQGFPHLAIENAAANPQAPVTCPKSEHKCHQQTGGMPPAPAEAPPPVLAPQPPPPPEYVAPPPPPPPPEYVPTLPPPPVAELPPPMPQPVPPPGGFYPQQFMPPPVPVPTPGLSLNLGLGFGRRGLLPELQLNFGDSGQIYDPMATAIYPPNFNMYVPPPWPVHRWRRW